MVAVLHPRPERTLTPMRSGQLTGGYLSSRWGQELGTPTGKLIVPETMNPARNFDPINVLLSGRRGAMKTATMAAIAKMLHVKFTERQNGFRVGSNIWMKFAQERGPLGYESDYDFDQDTGQIVTKSKPIDPCHARLIDRLEGFPGWGSRLLMCVDELAAVVNNRKSLSSYNTNFGVVLEQQRKQDNQFFFTTQFPQKVDTNSVLLQIDLFVVVRPHTSRKEADLFVFDIWNQWAEPSRYSYARRFPPLVGEHDWVVSIGNVDAIWNEYNTREIVPPSWLKDHRDRIIDEQWNARNRATWELDESAAAGDVTAPAGEAPADPIAEADQEIHVAMLRELPGEQPYLVNRGRRVLAKAAGGGRFISNTQAIEWLIANGYDVYEDSKKRQVLRRQP